MLPDLFAPVARYPGNWSGSVVVLAPGAIPTVDFYLTPRMAELPEMSVFRFDSRALDAVAQSLPTGAFVVIARHAAPAWLTYLEEHRARWSGVAFLMDDDIPAAWRCADVPLDYGWWTTGRYMRVRHLLTRICDRIWMSTDALRLRYPEARASLVGPMEFCPVRAPAPEGTRRWGYHGTRVHGRELRWLLPVVEAVQRALPEAQFELIGGKQVARLFADVPRVRVLPVMSWPDYVQHCRASALAVGVAPMLPGRFNAVRSHTKMFDITRCGAVGVFSARAPYAPMLTSAGASLLPDQTPAWAVEIIRLLQDDRLRLERYRAASAWVAEASRGGDISALIGENGQNVTKD